VKRRTIIFILLGSLLISSCKSKGNLVPVEEPLLNTPKIEEKVENETIDLNSKSRSYAVMINNASPARRLQSGLQDAYLIYEIIVESGITRYMALFMDAETERIGSIRSARHYFLDYAIENDAIYVHHGQSPQAQKDFNKLGLTRIAVGEPKTGWRENEHNVDWEHKLFTNIKNIEKGLSNKRTERNGELLLNYSEDAIDLSKIEGAKKANKVEVEYSSAVSNSYEYDSKTERYKRFINGSSHKDYITNKQYTFKNIIVVKIGNSLIKGDTKGRQELFNIGEKDGYYITNGYAVPIKAIKSSRTAKTVYKYLNGEEIVVSNGNTFIQIQPLSKKLNIED